MHMRCGLVDFTLWRLQPFDDTDPAMSCSCNESQRIPGDRPGLNSYELTVTAKVNKYVQYGEICSVGCRCLSLKHIVDSLANTDNEPVNYFQCRF